MSKTFPWYVSGLIEVGDAYMLMKDPESAQKHFEEAVRIVREDAHQIMPFQLFYASNPEI